MKSVYNDVMKILREEKTKISKKVLDVLNAEGIAGVIAQGC